MINIYESIDRIFEKELAKKVLQEDLTEIDFEDALNELYTRISTYLDTHDCFKVSLLDYTKYPETLNVIKGFEPEIKEFGPGSKTALPALIESLIDLLENDWEIEHFVDQDDTYYFYKGGKKPRCLRKKIAKNLTESEMSKLALDVKEAGGKFEYIKQIHSDIAKLRHELKALEYDHSRRTAGDNYDDEDSYQEAKENLIDRISELEKKAKLVDKQL